MEKEANKDKRFKCSSVKEIVNYLILDEKDVH